MGRDGTLARPLSVSVLDERLAVCRLDPGSGIPRWAVAAPFFSLTRTTDELSVVCPEHHVPPSVTCERGWRALKLEGPFDLALTGVLASVVAPLARAGVSVFAVATYDTDYVLVRESDLDPATSALLGWGHTVWRAQATCEEESC